MADLPFNPFYNGYTTRQNILAYVDGPDNVGQVLTSGQFYSGRWGGWYSIASQSFKYAKASNNSFNLTVNSDGTNFGNLIPPATSNILRISNVGMAFDENANPVMSFQDNGDSNVGFFNPPLVTVATTGLSLQFSGKNAVLFATVQTNYPYGIPNFLYKRYQTGDVACYYSIENDKIYSRYKSENFAIQRLMSSGVPNSGMAFANINVYPFIDRTSQEYPPFRKVYSSISADGRTLRLIQGAPTINFAADTFQNYLSGEAPAVLVSGYGRWIVSTLLGATVGRQFTAQPRVQDDFEAYSSGEIANLISGYLVYPQITVPTTGRVYVQGLLIEPYTGYATGYDTTFDKGFINFKTIVVATSGRSYDPDLYFFEGYENYASGLRNTFLSFITGKQYNGVNGSDGRSFAGWSPLQFLGILSGLQNLGLGPAPFTGSGRLNIGNNDLITRNYVGYPYKGTGIFFNNNVFSWQRPLDPITDFTVEIAAWPSGWATSDAKIIEANPVAGFSLGRYSTTNNVAFILNNVTHTGTFSLGLNDWNFLSFSRSGGVGSLYWSGNLMNTFPVSTGAITGGVTVSFGKNFTSNSQRFLGYLDEFRFWDTVRTTGEIYRDWNILINPQPDLIGYFSLRDYSS